MDRLTFAYSHRERYLDWAGQVSTGPWSVADRVEWAVISAHTPFAASVDGWRKTRGLVELEDMAEALAWAGVVGPAKKAAWCLTVRAGLVSGEIPPPTAPFAAWRKGVKIAGLGWCKQSFAACLVEPLTADIICLDTHMIQAVYERRPTQREIGAVHANNFRYAAIESRLLHEAQEIGVLPFPYQWAVWDWTRARTMRVPPSDHSFLWRGGATAQQLPLFSGEA